MNEIAFSTLIGKTLTKFEKIGIDYIDFHCSDGSVYRMQHHQDCCESVTIDDICGDPELLIGEVILQAEENSNSDESGGGSTTWTFYRMATNHGSLVIRWCGQSNGYYSESVSFNLIGQGINS